MKPTDITTRYRLLQSRYKGTSILSRNSDDTGEFDTNP
jgi:hypothetical protein